VLFISDVTAELECSQSCRHAHRTVRARREFTRHESSSHSFLCRASVGAHGHSLGSRVVVVGWVIYTFNRLIRLRQLSNNAWSDIDVQLKRRHDLIPNVVAVVQGHASYERGTLEALVAARGRAIQATNSGPATRAREEDPLGSELRRVVAVAEAYPELKSRGQLRGPANDPDGRRRTICKTPDATTTRSCGISIPRSRNFRRESSPA